MDDYFNQGKSTRRTIGFVMVLAFHLLLIWGLMNGLTQKIVDVVESFDIAEIDEPPPPEEEVIPPPPPDIVEPPPFVPLPDIVISTAPASETAIRDTTQVIAPKGPTVGVRQDPKRPVSQPDYPPSSKRLEQEGVVGLLLYVGPDGRVIETRLDKSSGFPALDNAAVKESARWRFLPAQDEGKPVAAWYRISVRFRIEDA